MTEKGCQDYLTCEECRDNGICHWSGSSCSSWEHVSPVCPSPERTTPADSLPEAATLVLSHQSAGIGWGWIVAAGMGGFLAGTLLVYWGRRLIASIGGRIRAFRARQANYAYQRQSGNGLIPPGDEERAGSSGHIPAGEELSGTAAEGLSQSDPVEEYVRPPFLDDVDGDETGDDSLRRSERLRDKESRK